MKIRLLQMNKLIDFLNSIPSFEPSLSGYGDKNAPTLTDTLFTTE